MKAEGHWWITGMQAVSAAGWGVPVNWRCVYSATRAMSAANDGAPPIMAGLIDMDAAPAEYRALSGVSPVLNLALWAGIGATEQADCGAADGLVLATTKADIDGLWLGGERAGYAVPGHVLDRLAQALGIHGPRAVVNCACASGLAGVIHGCRWIDAGWCRRVLVIGVDVVSRFVRLGFASLGALSSGLCKPFDAERDGLNLGESAAAVMLEASYTHRSLGAVRGMAMTNDAHHLTAPSRDGLQLSRAIELALSRSGRRAGGVHWINAHGTGTRYNDQMESLAIARVFGDRVPVSSLKPIFGHCLGAAGVLELIMSIQAMHDRWVPGTAGLQQVGVDGALALPTEGSPASHMDCVLTLKTGFGGINAAMVVETGHG